MHYALLKNKTILHYTPLNFYKSSIGLFIKILLVFTAAFIFVVITSANHRSNHLLLFGFVILGALIITLLQTWLNNVYIYEVILNDNLITLKWQELKLFKEETVNIDNITVKLKPSGKNTPYLEIVLKINNKEKILKQTYYPGWNKNTMQDFISSINKLKNDQKSFE